MFSLRTCIFYRQRMPKIPYLKPYTLTLTFALQTLTYVLQTLTYALKTLTYAFKTLTWSTGALVISLVVTSVVTSVVTLVVTLVVTSVVTLVTSWDPPGARGGAREAQLLSFCPG
jgi:hypothetical protein